MRPFLPTVAGLFSVVCSFTRSLSCVPWLHGRYPLLRYYGRSDFLRLALRLSASMNAIASGGEVHCLLRQRFLPFRLQSCDMHQRAFVSSLFVSSAYLIGFYLGIAAAPAPGAWVSAQGFAFTWHARPSYHTESSSSLGSLEPRSLRTGSLLPVALHGRITPPQFLSATGPVTLILTETSTPLRCALSQSHQATPNGVGAGESVESGRGPSTLRAARDRGLSTLNPCVSLFPFPPFPRIPTGSHHLAQRFIWLHAPSAAGHALPKTPAHSRA